jgi:hypothetical protein
MTAMDWTPDQLARKARVEKGETVVATLHEDRALLAWGKASGLAVRIGRPSEWGNPFEMPDDGDRDTVIEKFARYYLPHKPALIRKLPTLKGKILACWCYPERCHGDILCERISQEP